MKGMDRFRGIARSITRPPGLRFPHVHPECTMRTFGTDLRRLYRGALWLLCNHMPARGRFETDSASGMPMLLSEMSLESNIHLHGWQLDWKTGVQCDTTGPHALANAYSWKHQQLAASPRRLRKSFDQELPETNMCNKHGKLLREGQDSGQFKTRIHSNRSPTSTTAGGTIPTPLSPIPKPLAPSQFPVMLTWIGKSRIVLVDQWPDRKSVV